MSKRANPALVGTFVLFGIVLFFIAIMLFGSGVFFKGTETYVLHFPNVNGLIVGAPVKFKGVPIGLVTDIRINNDRAKDEAIAVILNIDDEYLDIGTNPGNLNIKTRADFEEEIRKGLTAQLGVTSFLTGLLYIELDYVTDEEKITQRLIYHAHSADEMRHSGYKEIPTARSELAELQHNVIELMPKISAVIQELSDKLQMLKVDKLNDSLLSAAKGMDKLLNSPHITNALSKLNPLLSNVQKLFDQLNSEVNPIAGEIKDSLKSMQGSLNVLTSMVDERSSLRHQVDTTLKKLAEAADKIGWLAEYLERNPNALLTGRAHDENKTP